MAFYQRRLPHWQPLGHPLFVTWRLHGSLPSPRVFPAESLTSGRAFVAMDRLLDQASTGPRYLSQPAIARLVVEALHYGQASLQHYTLHAFVVMANHLHLLITPQVALPKLLRSLKGNYRQAGQPNPGLDRSSLLARGELRSLGAGWQGVRSPSSVHRAEPCQGGAGEGPGALPVVERHKRTSRPGGRLRPRGAAPLHVFTNAGANVETPEQGRSPC